MNTFVCLLFYNLLKGLFCFLKKKSNHFTITCYAVITSNYGIKILFVPLNIHIVEERYKRDGDPLFTYCSPEQINTERRGRVEDVGC